MRAVRREHGLRRTGPAAMGWARGFSLLELMLVLVVLVIAYGIASPMVANLNGSGDLKSSTRLIAAALKRARNDAIVGRKETPLTFDLEARTLAIEGEPKKLQLPVKLELQLYTVQQELATDKVASIRFYPDGSSTGGRVTVGRDEARFEIDVDWLTGRVRINHPG
jgi:general secretion pathway protein H